MATLYERISGVGLADASERIGIHAFCSAINELRRGKITPAEMAALFALDASQQSDVQQLRDLAIAAPEKTEFMRVFRDCLYLAETGYMYLTAGALVSRLQTEVTDQGGTLP